MAVTLAMDIELYGGPADGMVLTVPDDATIQVVPAPAMTPAEFIALESGAPYRVSVEEHLYHVTAYRARGSKLRVFSYGGSRRAR